MIMENESRRLREAATVHGKAEAEMPVRRCMAAFDP